MTPDQFAGFIDRLDAIEGCLHQLQRAVGRLSAPVELMTAEEVCSTLKISRSGLSKIDARSLFSDARQPGTRVRGRPRMYFRDEVTVYATEGAAGVRRFRREVGRL